ncbi:MAG: hypothetical protein E7388_03230 [Ruminococcaceae bacterium]|nr:hypothetical protein [Oscillospiraceae bacterium]
MNTAQQGVVTLLKSAVTGAALKLPDNFSLEDEFVKETIKKHHLSTLVYAGALNCGISKESPFMKSLFKAYYKHTLRSEQQMLIVKSVFDAFDKNGIDYLPTKGCNMKALYPKPELRLMGDADITVRKNQLNLISQILENMGFTKSHEDDNNVNWDKGALHMEIHLRMKSFYQKDYYSDVWSKVKPVAGHRYTFNTEDTFIHLFNHFARHYRSGGIGIRHVLDLYVYRMKNPDMDEKYIYREMCVLKLQDFYKNVLSLLDVWFGDGESSEATDLISDTILQSGSWGNVTSHVLSKEVTKANKKGELSSSRRKLVVSSLFPPKSYMAVNYKVVERYPFLLPLFWVIRGVEVLISRPKKFRSTVRAWKNIDDKKVSEKQRQLKMVGLDLTDDESN